jgi:sentrin-specific protease 1
VDLTAENLEEETKKELNYYILELDNNGEVVEMLPQEGAPPPPPPPPVLAQVYSVVLTRAALLQTRVGVWFRCCILNFFFMLLRRAGEAALVAAVASGAPDGVAAGAVWCHNSYFYAKLMEFNGPAPKYDYPGVRGWTAGPSKRAATDLFAYRWVILPVNRGNVHWTMAVIDNRERTVVFLDSLGGDGSDVTEALLRYVADEYQDKKGKPLPAPYRVVAQPADLPRQENSVDCGPFVCAFGECFYRGVLPSSLLFSQRDMLYWRQRVAIACLCGLSP